MTRQRVDIVIGNLVMEHSFTVLQFQERMKITVIDNLVLTEQLSESNEFGTVVALAASANQTLNSGFGSDDERLASWLSHKFPPLSRSSPLNLVQTRLWP